MNFEGHWIRIST